MVATTASIAPGALQAGMTHKCEAKIMESGNLIVASCRYHFTISSGETEVGSAVFNYLLLYELEGDEPISEEDLDDFAFANGTYHSWPFVRQLLFDLTSRMGYPPYTLPVMKFNPKSSVKAGTTPPEKSVAHTSPPEEVPGTDEAAKVAKVKPTRRGGSSDG
jgi:hypothetical protein